MQDVAKRLDVSTGLIHYHFDNKDALLSAAFQLAADATSSGSNASWATSRGRSPSCCG